MLVTAGGGTVDYDSLPAAAVPVRPMGNVMANSYLKSGTYSGSYYLYNPDMVVYGTYGDD